MLLLPTHLYSFGGKILPAGLFARIIVFLIFLIDYFSIVGVLGLSANIAFHHVMFILTNTTTLEAMRGPPKVFTAMRKSITKS